jgi:hypothetical protein
MALRPTGSGKKTRTGLVAARRAAWRRNGARRVMAGYRHAKVPLGGIEPRFRFRLNTALCARLGAHVPQRPSY